MRKPLFLSIVGLFLLAFSQAQKTITTYHGLTTKIHEQYQTNAQGVKNGSFKLFDIEGRLLRLYNYTNGDLNGLCTDYAIYIEPFYCLGKPLVEKQYKAGSVLWVKEYRCDGKVYGLMSKEDYVDKDLFKRVEFYPNGKTKRTFQIANLIDANGQNGHIPFSGPFVSFYETGAVSEKGNYLDTKKTGVWVRLTDKGDTAVYEQYEFDIPYVQVKYHSKGLVSTRVKTDSLFGEQQITDYDKSGKTISIKWLAAYPFNEAVYSDKADKPKNWREYARFPELDNQNPKNPFISHSYVRMQVNFKDGLPTDTVRRYLAVERNKQVQDAYKYIVLSEADYPAYQKRTGGRRLLEIKEAVVAKYGRLDYNVRSQIGSSWEQRINKAFESQSPYSPVKDQMVNSYGAVNFHYLGYSNYIDSAIEILTNAVVLTLDETTDEEQLAFLSRSAVGEEALASYASDSKAFELKLIEWYNLKIALNTAKLALMEKITSNTNPTKEFKDQLKPILKKSGGDRAAGILSHFGIQPVVLPFVI